MRIVAFVVVLLVSSSAPTWAQPALTPVTAPAPASEKPKNRGLAFLLSAGGTLLPVAIFASGIHSDSPGTVLMTSTLAATFGPAAGHWYAEDYFTVGTGMRLVGAATAGIALWKLVISEDCACKGTEDVFWGGLGLIAIGAVVDVATAGNAVDDWNHAHATRIAPTLMKTSSGYGIGLAGTF